MIGILLKTPEGENLYF